MGTPTCFMMRRQVTTRCGMAVRRTAPKRALSVPTGATTTAAAPRRVAGCGSDALTRSGLARRPGPATPPAWMDGHGTSQRSARSNGIDHWQTTSSCSHSPITGVVSLRTLPLAIQGSDTRCLGKYFRSACRIPLRACACTIPATATPSPVPSARRLLQTVRPAKFARFF